jgi:hypothetical protein
VRHGKIDGRESNNDDTTAAGNTHDGGGRTSEKRDDQDLTRMELSMRERMNEINHIGGRLGRKEEKR